MPDAPYDIYCNHLETRGYFNGPAPKTQIPGTWKLVGNIGEGGEAINYLYVYVDSKGRILDRVVQRNVRVGTTLYNSDLPWNANALRTIPEEAWIMEMASGPGVLGLRSCVVDPNQALIVLYLEYASYGNLESLIEAQQETGRRRWGRKFRVLKKAPFKESFLWHLFRTLVMGVDSMKEGGATADPQVEYEIVHGDVHPGNIFLDTEDQDTFSIFPTPVLGDFGSAYATHLADARDHNDRALRAHKPRWCPPELVRSPRHQTFQSPTKALTPANICAVGLVMVACMRLQKDISPRIDFYNPDVDNHNAAEYSQDLKDLVRGCLLHDPASGPEPVALLRMIQRRGLSHFCVMERYHPGRKVGNHKEKLRISMSDKYRVGKKYAK